MLVQTTHFQRAVTLLSLMRTPHPSLILEKCLHCKYTFPGSAQPLRRELQHIPPDGFSAHPVLCTGGSFSAAMGFIVFGQIPDALSWIGYALICAMAVAMFFYNNRKTS